MGRFPSIVLTLVFLIGGTECRQLLKFPALLEHYAEHKAQNPAISFVDFLGMHYIGDDQNNSDEERDRQLPFKAPSSSGADFSSLSPVLPDGPPGITPSRESVSFPSDVNFHSQDPSSIWQPPKIA